MKAYVRKRFLDTLDADLVAAGCSREEIDKAMKSVIAGIQVDQPAAIFIACEGRLVLVGPDMLYFDTATPTIIQPKRGLS